MPAAQPAIHQPGPPQRRPARIRGFARLQAAAWLLVLVVLPGYAHAQINRCTSPEGNVLYTDTDCNPGELHTEIAPARSNAEIEADRLRAEEAASRRHRQQEEQLQPRSQAPATAPASTARQEADRVAAYHENSRACQDARRTVARHTDADGRYDRAGTQRLQAAQEARLQACLGPAAYADLQSRRALAPAAPQTVIRRPHVVVPGPMPAWPGLMPAVPRPLPAPPAPPAPLSPPVKPPGVTPVRPPGAMPARPPVIMPVRPSPEQP